jgi:intein/homing endonuclease
MEKELNLKESQKHGALRLSKIIEKKDYIYEGKVYDIKVSNAHSYTIDDIIVHNSSGSSLLLYLLGITRIDPIRWDFPFARFLNEKKIDVNSERIRIHTETGVIDLKPNQEVKVNGVLKKAKDLKDGEDFDLQ